MTMLAYKNLIMKDLVSLLARLLATGEILKERYLGAHFDQHLYSAKKEPQFCISAIAQLSGKSNPSDKPSPEK